MFSDRTNAAQNVFAVGHRFKMSGVHAVPRTTDVIQLKSGRDRTDKGFVCNAMRTELLRVPDRELTVAFSVDRSHPRPALKEAR